MCVWCWMQPPKEIQQTNKQNTLKSYMWILNTLAGEKKSDTMGFMKWFFFLSALFAIYFIEEPSQHVRRTRICVAHAYHFISQCVLFSYIFKHHIYEIYIKMKWHNTLPHAIYRNMFSSTNRQQFHICVLMHANFVYFRKCHAVRQSCMPFHNNFNYHRCKFRQFQTSISKME